MIPCPQCKIKLPRQMLNTKGLVACPACRVPLRADVYPALLRPVLSGRSGGLLLVDQEAGCFYHPRKKATVACSACGRFLCSLCDIEFNGRHLCPQCLEKGKAKRKIKNLEVHRVCYDKIALWVAVVSTLFFYVAIITAPVVLFMTIRYWNAPTSIIPRTRIRFILAFAIAILQIAGWIVLIMHLASR